MRPELKILTIGNSFTDSLEPYFVPVAAAAGRRIRFERANFGGCELERHWCYIVAEEASPACRIYRGGQTKLSTLLAGTDWDFVSIQQASPLSWRPETYQPYARNIFAFIRRHAPGAEVVVQQTWAYRADDPRLLPGGEWGIGQKEMYARLTENYRRLAAELGGLRIIPAGYAVELARAAEPAPFAGYDPGLMEKLAWPDLPPQAGDVAGRCWWEKDRETGALRLKRDTIHLNERGQYLQACVWFAALCGRPVAETAGFVPAAVGDDDAARLRETAQRAVDEFNEQ